MTQPGEPQTNGQDDNILLYSAVNAAIQMAVSRERRAFVGQNGHIINEVHTFSFTYVHSTIAVTSVKAWCVMSPDREWLQVAITVMREGQQLSMRNIYHALAQIGSQSIVRLHEDDDTLLYYLVSTRTI